MKLSQLFGSEGGLSSQIDRPVVIIAIVIYLIMCSRQGLNLRPCDYESPALTDWATGTINRHSREG